MKISIVIPIYNVELYLQRCLNSIAIQKNDNGEPYEVILVNDGSTDNSLEIAEEYANKYGWKLINQRNKGLSVARNVGMANAISDYVWFIDSDDWIKDNALQIICESVTGQDVIAIGHTIKYDEETNTSLPIKDIYNGRDLLKANFALCAPFYIFNRNFLHKYNLFFYPNIFHEDFEFVPRMLYCSQNASSITIPLYHVFKRENSITTTINPKRAFDMLKVIESLSHFSHQEVKETEIQLRFNDLISLGLNNSLKCSSPLKGSSLALYIETLFATNCISHLCKSTKLKYKIEGYLAKYFPKSLLIFRLVQI